MGNVIKENLRIQPPVAYVPTRVVKEDIEFEGKLIPKGVRASIRSKSRPNITLNRLK